MKSICLVFALLFSVVSIAQKSQTDWDKELLYGRVKTIAYFDGYVDDPTGTGALIIDSSDYKVDSFSNTGHKISQSTIKYGGETIRQQFVSNDTAEYTTINDMVVERTEIQRDVRQNIVEKWVFDGDGQIRAKSDYDTLGNIMLLTGYDSDTPWTWRIYTYESGRITIEKDSTDLGVARASFYNYNDKGQLTKIERLELGQCSSTSVLVFTYDDRGNRTSRTSSRGGSHDTLTWKYDSHDNPVLEESVKNGIASPTITWEYDYDKQGNWTRRLIITNRGPDIKTRSIAIRKIEYY